MMLLHLLLCIPTASAFTPSTRGTKSSLHRQSSLAQVREGAASSSQSIFDNIQYTSRSTAAIIADSTTIISGDTVREARSGYAPVSQSTGQVGTIGVIGDTTTTHHHRPASLTNYNDNTMNASAFNPHSSTGASRVAPNSCYDRHAPVDYNACKSFTVSESDLYFEQSSASTNNSNTTPRFNRHSSMNGISSDKRHAATTNVGYTPTDYNSSKSFTTSQNEISYFRPNNNDDDANNFKSTGRNDNSKPTPFIPHSSTGAGGGRMSSSSPLYQRGNSVWDSLPESRSDS